MFTTMAFIHQRDHGGSVLGATRYSIQRRCVVNHAAILFRGIVVPVRVCACGTQISSSANIASFRCGRCCRLEREASVKKKSTGPRCATVLGNQKKVGE